MVHFEAKKTAVSARSAGRTFRKVAERRSGLFRFNLRTGAVIIQCAATGCANIIPPEDAYLKRVDDGSVVVGCYETRQTWLLTCQGSQWTGTVGACDPRTNPHDHDDTLPGSTFTSVLTATFPGHGLAGIRMSLIWILLQQRTGGGSNNWS